MRRAFPGSFALQAIGVGFFLCTFLASGCSPKKLPAYGAANKIMIVTNLGNEEGAVTLLRSGVEGAFVLGDSKIADTTEVVSAEDFSRHARRYDASRNLVFLVDVTRPDALTKKTENLLGTNVLRRVRAGSAEYFVRRDVWSLGQTLTIIAGAGELSLREVISRSGKRLYAEMDSLAVESGKLFYHAGTGAGSN